MTTFKPKIWKTLGAVAAVGVATGACAYDPYGHGYDTGPGWYGERGERGDRGERGERGDRGERGERGERGD